MEHLAELKVQVDDLALRLVMADCEGPAAALACLSALESIRDAAARHKAAPVAAAAEELIRALPLAAAPAAVLSEGVAALQRAIELAAAGSPQPAASAPASLAQDPELMNDFIVESNEHLANIETQVLTLEREPCESEALHAAFRGFHTIKGLAGFLELWDVQKLAHEVEAVLDRARNGERALDSAAIDAVLASTDHLRQWLGYLQNALQGIASQPPATPTA
ncbi:MAG: Hpt domain-containing protein, partial [Acidobacteriota bacterium]|nr:Hpt domain-containing protein [Acidobacteriota bacterium]